MALSSVSVVANSLRLRRLDLRLDGGISRRPRRGAWYLATWHLATGCDAQNAQNTGTTKTATAKNRSSSGSPSFQ